jgi:outer membrane protein assembly factor BamA
LERYLIPLLLLFALMASSQHEPEKTAKRKFLGFKELNDTINEEKSGIFILPLLYYTPDTRWAFGAAGVYYFKITPRQAEEKETRVSNAQFLADYTQNRQLDLWGVWNIFTRNENYLLKGEARYRNFPDRFYGIGNNTRKDSAERYEYNLLSLKNLVMKQVFPALFLGVDYHIEKEYGFRYTAGGILQSGTVRGFQGSIGSAFGLVAVYDNRDNVINTYRGRLAEVSSYYYAPELGSTFRFVYFNLLYQEFWQIKRRHILALQTKARLGTGHIPFLDMSTAGNDDLLRGYPKNRFRDRNFLGAQLEYRFPPVWRIGAVTFAGAGDVFHNFSDLEFRLVKYSAGAGLRFLINPAERLNVRLDYGYGNEGGHFYFIVTESF